MEPVHIIIAVAMALGFWVLFRQKPLSKGQRGERLVSEELARSLDMKRYTVFDDVTIPVDAFTVQIDHLIVSQYGVFVIETKNLSGWIFGNSEQQKWTQVHFNWKTQFQNPIRQNFGHVKTIESVLRLREHQVHGVVVMIGECRFKTEIPPSVVIGTRELIGFIRSKTATTLSEIEAAALAEAIDTKRLTPGKDTDRTHLLGVNKRLRAKATIPETACPRCGGQLVARTNRQTGEQFMGCKRYPACRGTRPIS